MSLENPDPRVARGGAGILTKCRSCRKAIFYALTPNGKVCPFDATPSTAANAIYALEPGGQQMRKATDSDERRYASHFTTCDHPNRFSKKGKS